MCTDPRRARSRHAAGQLVEREVGQGPGLVEIVVRDPEVPRVVVGIRVTGEIGSEERRGRARCDHDVARPADHRRGRDRGGRTRSPDDARDLRVGDGRPGRRRASLGRTHRVEPVAQVDLAALHRADVRDRELGGVAGRRPQRRRHAHREQRPDPYLLTPLQGDRPERPRFEAGRTRALAARYGERRRERRRAQSRAPCQKPHRSHLLVTVRMSGLNVRGVARERPPERLDGGRGRADCGSAGSSWSRTRPASPVAPKPGSPVPAARAEPGRPRSGVRLLARPRRPCGPHACSAP